MTFKPMLACKAPADLATLIFPLLVSPKLDGIRCIIRDGKAMSSKLLPIPNKYVQAQLAGLPDGLDGELMLTLPGSFSAVSSAVMSHDGEPEFTYCVFDGYSDKPSPYEERLRAVVNWHGSQSNTWKRLEIVPHVLVNTLEEMMAKEAEYVAFGFEGLMIRSLAGPYKCGRSTEREGSLLKLKRFEDAEAMVYGVVEMMHNDNEATTNEVGATKRSTAKAGKRPAGVLGALKCRRPDGVEFEIGSGFTAAQRAELWTEWRAATPPGSDGFGGCTVKYKFQPDPSEPNGPPRFPVFLGFRDEIDA